MTPRQTSRHVTLDRRPGYRLVGQRPPNLAVIEGYRGMTMIVSVARLDPATPGPRSLPPPMSRPDPQPACDDGQHADLNKIIPDQDKPCLHCPWLTSNHGKRHPDGWYTKTKRRFLWAMLRRGEEIMSCHPTDPANPVSDKARAAGYRPAPPGTTPRLCIGAIVLVQRELYRISTEYDRVPSSYIAANPRGLTRNGIAAWAFRIGLGGTPLSGPRIPRPDLNAPVSVEGVPPWNPETVVDPAAIEARQRPEASR